MINESNIFYSNMVSLVVLVPSDCKWLNQLFFIVAYDCVFLLIEFFLFLLIKQKFTWTFFVIPIFSGVTDNTSSAVMYFLSILLTLFWLFFGSGFVTMAISMLSYVMSVYTLDKFDLNCQPRTGATEKLKGLLDLMRELNWQLVKGKPDVSNDSPVW